jgi:hypothetical protein
MNYQDLTQFATVRQLEYLEALEQHGTIRKAAKALGCAKGTITDGLKSLRKKAALQGYSPEHDMVHTVPDGFKVKGVSTYYNNEGKAVGQWVKSSADAERQAEMMREAISDFIEGVGPINIAPAPLDFQSDVIPWIQIGDAHIGMLAHAAETNENFDLKIAERELCGAISMLIDEMPPCERIVINDLGDATHYDNLSATTAASHHALDADGRHPKMLRVYSKVMRFIVEKVSEKAKFVDVIVNQGNHSRINDFWMAELLRVAYGHTGRVNVLNNDSVFIPYRMGKTLVMVHHSDKCPPARLIGVMTSDYRKDFGETDHHYIDIGHVHHHFVSKEHPSVIIESWNHLAANDKWAHEAGYRSRKSITVVLRSKKYGDIGRRVLPIDEIREKLGDAHPKIEKTSAVYTV